MNVGVLAMAVDSQVHELRKINMRLFSLQQGADFDDPLPGTAYLEDLLDTVTENFQFLLDTVADKKFDADTQLSVENLISPAIRNELALLLRQNVENDADNFSDYMAIRNCAHLFQYNARIKKRLVSTPCVDDEAFVEMFLYTTDLYYALSNAVSQRVIQDLHEKRKFCDELRRRLANFKINHKIWT